MTAVPPVLRPCRVRGPGVRIVQQTRELLPLLVVPLHCGLEQRFLDLARDIAPYFHCRVPKQIGKVFFVRRPFPFSRGLVSNGTAGGVPLPSQKESQMGIFTKDIKSMEDLLIHGLQDIYYTEQQIIKSLPKM